jgi:TRAP-type C4-dicarboxylate transport system permease small subunit
MLAGQIGFGPSDDDATADARQRKAQRIVSLIIVLVGLVGLAWSCWVLYQDGIYGWQTTNWNGLEFAALLPLPFIFLLFVPALSSQARRNTLRRTLDPLQLLRLSTHLRLAPPATLQPAPLSAEEQVGAATFTALRSVAGPWQGAQSAWMLPSFAGYAIAMLVIIAPEALEHGFTTTILGVPSFVIYFPVYILAFGGVFFNMYKMTRGRRGLSVTANATGLRWRRRGSRQQERSLTWGSINLFAKVSTTLPYGTPITMFYVETEERGSRLTSLRPKGPCL